MKSRKNSRSCFSSLINGRYHRHPVVDKGAKSEKIKQTKFLNANWLPAAANPVDHLFSFFLLWFVFLSCFSYIRTPAGLIDVIGYDCSLPFDLFTSPTYPSFFERECIPIMTPTHTHLMNISRNSTELATLDGGLVRHGSKHSRFHDSFFHTHTIRSASFMPQKCCN